jgi:hypothetical protein
MSALWRTFFAPFTIIFAIMFGLVMDSLFYLFKVRASNGEVNMKRMAVSTTASTAIVGILSYYVTVYLLNMLPRNLFLEIGIIIAGVMNGAFGGYLATIIWKNNLKPFVGIGKS